MPARILIVDDDDESLRLTGFLLQALGHTPIPATSGREAIELSRASRPDLILMDIQMPKMDGFEVLRHIRAEPELASTPVVALTALAMVRDREAAAQAGFDGYITKPISLPEFGVQIDDFLPEQLRSTSPSGR